MISFKFFKIKKKDFSKISLKFLEKIVSAIAIILLLAFFFICFEIYVPLNPNSQEMIIFTVQKGWSDEEIAKNLEKLGIIRSNYFFRFYAVMSLKHSKLQAGEYKLSSNMSIHQIVNKIVRGDVIKERITIPEGWNLNDIGKYLESKNICSQSYFISLAQKDYSDKFAFLQDKPQDVSLEGYLFPDTYEISIGKTCDDILNDMLKNFDKKINQDLRNEIKNQGKSIFEIITMASIIEKEVSVLEDKKILSGIFWKRLEIGMPLQSCATINYITGKNDPAAILKDIQIDSPYNTYKYKGLPKGPICNPGMDSIIAAVYPTQTNYLYYLSNGKPVFSETLEEHNKAKYSR